MFSFSENSLTWGSCHLPPPSFWYGSTKEAGDEREL